LRNRFGVRLVAAIALCLAVPLLAAERPAPMIDERIKVVTPLEEDQPLDPHRRFLVVGEYVVEDGDVLSVIAQQHALFTDTLRWANNLDDPDKLKIGQVLFLPPVDGVLVRVGAGDTLTGLVEKFHSDLDTVQRANFLRPDELPLVGGWLMIPGGKGPAFVRPEPAPEPAPRRASPATGSSYVRPAVPVAYQSSNRFPFGQCTWYVAQKRQIPWNGNAWQWYGNAQAFGYRVGSQPRPGSIQVTWESYYYGHVAYVESVNGDGSWTVSEMNYGGSTGGGWGRVSWRRVWPGQVPLIGFIY
jgi:surface antigen/LysM repeat protein